jgi:hypothetical protein
MSEKLFEIEGDHFTLNEVLHNNTAPDQPRLEEEFIIRLISLKVGDVINDIDPNYPNVKRVQ